MYLFQHLLPHPQKRDLQHAQDELQRYRDGAQTSDQLLAQKDAEIKQRM